MSTPMLILSAAFASARSLFAAISSCSACSFSRLYFKENIEGDESGPIIFFCGAFMQVKPF